MAVLSRPRPRQGLAPLTPAPATPSDSPRSNTERIEPVERESAGADASPASSTQAVQELASSVARDPPEQSSIADAFAWTSRAADILLRVRFITLKDRFHDCMRSSQLRSALILLASEVSRLSGLVVKPIQCKSKVLHAQINSVYNGR
jgi:hypothetical protein